MHIHAPVSKSAASGKSGPVCKPGPVRGLALQRKCSSGPPEPDASFEPRFAFDLSRVRVHPDGQAAPSAGALDAHVADIAARGVAGTGGSLPHLARIQASFRSEHDLSQVQAYIGGKATEAANRIGAEAYAVGNRVAFREAPSLHTAAHEAAHVVQQVAGLGPAGGVGQVGDEHEHNADAVADRVVQGQSARELLRPARAARGPTVHAVQRIPSAGDTSPAEQLFNATHVYSKAPEAARKRKIDEDIMGGDFSKGSLIDMSSGAYLKELVRRASKGQTTVKAKSKELQFFIVKGGAEGFLPSAYRGIDASNITRSSVTTTGAPGTTMRFDNNDLICVFGTEGQMISSALLQRPLSITNPNIWTEQTANKVYDAWDNQYVSLYKNQNPNFDIKYMGLQVDDKLGYYQTGKARIDLHKQEATNGCIFLVDPNTPSYSDPAKLSAFEPKFITDVMNEVGSKRYHIGIMHMITIN